MAVAVTTPDYPNLRRLSACPCCSRVKQLGAIVCWPCYRLHDFRGGIPRHIEVVLKAAELMHRPAPKGWDRVEAGLEG